ncbi:MAG TPA: TOMM precursor leader peptide-binding protein, partial [Pseudonocardia sp.]|nr:TOMM precursor leader peptide-binding protein [Pseudonocardia sp.]
AAGLGLAGIGTVHVRAGGPVMAADLGTGLVDADRGRPREEAAATAVAALAPDVLTGPPPARLAADLVVLADALVPEPEQVAALHAARTAHLVVRLRDGTGVVGPLVLPRRTACLRCLDLHRNDHDPAWPRVAAQLIGRPGRADPACVTATAALATAQALTALDGISGGAQAPAVLDATLELDVAAGTLVRRDWTPHPDCGCGVTAPPETQRGMAHG